MNPARLLPAGRSGWLRLGLALLVWLVASVAIGLLIFLHSSRSLVVASHNASVRPTLSGYAVLRTGPILPDLRIATGRRVGVDITFGKTVAVSPSSLIERYAVLAAQPQGQIDKVTSAVQEMAVSAALRGVVLGFAPIGLWLLVGPDRRRQLRRGFRDPRTYASAMALVVGGVVFWQPWAEQDPPVELSRDWVALPTFLGPKIHVPDELAKVAIRDSPLSRETQRLVESAISSYGKGQAYYRRAVEDAASLDLRQPREGETVAVLVSDRHDNVGMDPVARAIADRAGASLVFDTGDDTSTGAAWEAFSLDSVTAAFKDLPRYSVTGNHDHGTFVGDYLAKHGWRTLTGSVVDSPVGPLLGVPDPRSSGLGSWKDENGVSFEEVESQLADEACASDERISTVLVHDATLARELLERGCADLVLAGHLHVVVGPTRVVGDNGEIGYSFTTGTTGGAAYAVAVGTKPRRDATVTLVTYRDQRPVGLQTVTLQTPNGHYVVDDYHELVFTDSQQTAGQP
jgi:predicted phosphodiesterase